MTVGRFSLLVTIPLGITEIMFKIWITGFQSNPNEQITGLHFISNWDYGITCLLKLGSRDYTPFVIGILGLQVPPPPLQGPICSLLMKIPDFDHKKKFAPPPQSLTPPIGKKKVIAPLNKINK